MLLSCHTANKEFSLKATSLYAHTRIYIYIYIVHSESNCLRAFVRHARKIILFWLKLIEVGRLEFQDGKRKRGQFKAPQFYHGRGAIHVHVLVWLTNIPDIALDRVVRADIPAEAGPLRDLVLGGQLDWEKSGWNHREEQTSWEAESNRLLLHHPAEAFGKNCRAYLEDLLGSLRCHCDVLGTNGRDMILQYCSKYLPKFSSSFCNEVLGNEQATGFALSRRVLEQYHPLAPEMVLQMAGQQFPQCFVGGHIRKISVPIPTIPAGEDTLVLSRPSEAIELYQTCSWRGDGMTFKEYLRKSGRQKGTIHQKFRRLHKKLEVKEPLEDWIKDVATSGQIMVAPIMYSRTNDKFYGQWLLLNVPFRKLHDLWHPSVLKVPSSYRLLALCLHHCGSAFWRQISTKVKPALQREAHSKAKIENLLAMLQAQTELIDSYLSGELSIEEHPEPVLPMQQNKMLQAGVTLAMEQVGVVQSIDCMTRESLALRWPAEDDADAWVDWFARSAGPQKNRDRKPLAVLGPAGSGKTTVVECAIANAVAMGAHVAVACPTGLLSVRYKDRLTNVDVDTIHGMFALHRHPVETLHMMQDIDVLIIDEVGQISQDIFERLMEMWDAAERRPAFIFVGDFAQLAGADGTRACHSNRWAADVKVFSLRTMRRCKCPKLRKKLELLRYFTPSQQELKEILRGHQAPRNSDRDSRGENPSFEDIQQIFAETPDTIFTTISRWATGYINEQALKVFFGDREPLAYVPADPEANPNNFEGKKQVRWDASQLPIHEGLRLTLTRNPMSHTGLPFLVGRIPKNDSYMSAVTVVQS